MGHIFRRGGASWVITQRILGKSIQILGDWKSSAHLSHYNLDITAKTNTMYMFSNKVSLLTNKSTLALE